MTMLLVDFFTSLPQSIIFCICSRACLDLRKPWLYYTLLCLPTNIIHVVGIHYWPEALNAKGFIIVSMIIVCNLVFSRDSLGRTALFTTALCALMMLSELIFSGFWALLFPMPYVEFMYESPWNLALLKTIILAVCAILCRVLTQIWNKKLRRYDSFFGAFVLFPISQCVLIVVIVSFGLSHYDKTMIYNYTAIAGVICLFADILIFRAISKLGDQRVLESQKLLVESQLKAQEDYYDRLVDTIEQVSRLRHDMANQLQTVYALLDSGELSTAKKHTDELKRRWDGAATREFCENRLVDALLSEKKRKFAETGVTLAADVRLPQTTGVEGVDLCSVFFNLVDNAYSACKNLPAGRREISISSALTAGVLLVRVVNPYDGCEPVKPDKRQGTIRDHGLGLGILQNIVEKYNGKLEIKTSDGEFSATVWLNTALGE